jgi:DegV family protein with EDD domain
MVVTAMKVKVITDSTSDIPHELADALGITMVPVYVRFGDVVYRDGEEITSDEFFQKLTSLPVHPATSQPTPEDFTKVYSKYYGNVDGIVSIHISAKISGTFNSALLSAKTMETPCRIEVIDSKFNSAGLALVVMAAAQLANDGVSIQDIITETHKMIEQVHMFGMFNTMKYLARSGRISKTVAAAANIIDVKPLLTFSDGEIVRAGLVRTMAKGIDRIYDYIGTKIPIQELMIVHSAVPDEANRLKQRLTKFLPEDKILIARLGAALGVHGGPGVLVMALRQLKTDE